MPKPDVPPFPNLAAAAKATMEYLQQYVGLGQWMFTRVDGDDWVVLDTLGDEYPIAPGSLWSWADGFCSRMARGEGPMLAPQLQDVPAYAAAPVAQALHVESYVGMPIFRKDGSLFRTMCAIDAAPSPDIERHQPLVELMARMLGFAVDRQSDADNAARQAESAESEALTDGLTGLFNRRGWDRLLAREDERCIRYGYPACVFVVDLDHFKAINDTLGHDVGDTTLRGVAACLKATFRGHDVVARTGGDEFSILAVECDGGAGEQLLVRLEAKLRAASLEASVGFAYRPATRLADVWKFADEAMYATKRKRESERRVVA